MGRSVNKKNILEITQEYVVVLDAGNSIVKASLLGGFGNEIDFPHAVHQTTESDYERETRASRYSGGVYKPPVDGSIIKYKSNGVWNFLSVGQPALAFADGYTRLLGPAKYRKEHLGPLLVTAMLHLGFCDNLSREYDGIEYTNIHVVGLHPTDVDENQLNDYIAAVTGAHIFELPNGQKIKFNVNRFSPTTEAASILTTFMLNIEGNTYRYYGNTRQELNFDAPQTRILVIDVGGGLISIAPVIVTSGGVDMSIGASSVVPVGVLNVIEKFKSEIKSSFKQHVGHVQRITDDHLYRAALKDGFIKFDGRLGDSHMCDSEIERSIPSLINALRDEVNRNFSGGIGFDYIVIGGGGGGVMFKYIRELVFNSRSGVFMAEFDDTKMQYGAVRGASKGFLQSKSAKRIRRK